MPVKSLSWKWCSSKLYRTLWVWYKCNFGFLLRNTGFLCSDRQCNQTQNTHTTTHNLYRQKTLLSWRCIILINYAVWVNIFSKTTKPSEPVTGPDDFEIASFIGLRCVWNGSQFYKKDDCPKSIYSECMIIFKLKKSGLLQICWSSLFLRILFVKLSWSLNALLFIRWVTLLILFLHLQLYVSNT